MVGTHLSDSRPQDGDGSVRYLSARQGEHTNECEGSFIRNISF